VGFLYVITLFTCGLLQALQQIMHHGLKDLPGATVTDNVEWVQLVDDSLQKRKSLIVKKNGF
jgi:hypothetical protein